MEPAEHHVLFLSYHLTVWAGGFLLSDSLIQREA